MRNQILCGEIYFFDLSCVCNVLAVKSFLFKCYFKLCLFVVVATVLDSAIESATTFNSSNFGGWEAHTRGIGSKLMLKMGYEYGKGKSKWPPFIRQITKFKL